MKADWFNMNLLTLKFVLFLFFGAIGALLPFIPLHMNDLGLSRDEQVIVSAISPLLALLGPVIAAPLADRLAGGFGGAPRSKTGRYLRVMILVCCILANIFYWLLSVIPPIKSSPPSVSFACNETGGWILQDRCGSEKTCYNWGSGKGSVLVKNCIFTCNASSSYKSELSTVPPIVESSPEIPDDYYDPGAIINNEPEDNLPQNKVDEGIEKPYPHMCFRNSNGDNICEVYTEPYAIKLNLGLTPSVSSDSNDTDSTCEYPFDEPFVCRIPSNRKYELRRENGEDCEPMVICEIQDPYNNTDSLLKRSQCGYNNVSFWLYLFIKSFADIFVAAAVTLLGTAVVIATRETSTGRGDIGKQFACGALGFGIFAALIGGAANGRYLEAVISFTILMVIAVILLAADEKMPLSPPEWWWHTRCGLLALPMSSVRKYGLETAALGIILLLLGVFWNSIDSFLPWHVATLQGDPLSLGLTVTIGAIPAAIFLCFAEIIVDYCGHSNILIFCFVNYICHHLMLVNVKEAYYLLFCEFLEIFTLHIMYVTAVLYLRHLVPRKLTACGQALPIVAHFCIGRCIGALLGGIAYDDNAKQFELVHRWFTIAAAIVAFIYYFTYHFYLKPKCSAPVHLPPDPAPAVIQAINGGGNENGSYTPLRVYHNSKSKKGHFRY